MHWFLCCVSDGVWLWSDTKHTRTSQYISLAYVLRWDSSLRQRSARTDVNRSSLTSAAIDANTGIQWEARTETSLSHRFNRFFAKRQNYVIPWHENYSGKAHRIGATERSLLSTNDRYLCQLCRCLSPVRCRPCPRVLTKALTIIAVTAVLAMTAQVCHWRRRPMTPTTPDHTAHTLHTVHALFACNCRTFDAFTDISVRAICYRNLDKTTNQCNCLYSDSKLAIVNHLYCNSWDQFEELCFTYKHLNQFVELIVDSCAGIERLRPEQCDGTGIALILLVYIARQNYACGHFLQIKSSVSVQLKCCPQNKHMQWTNSHWMIIF